SNEHDAFAHKNGVAYQQGRAPLYWYQNEYWIAYYAKTYLGKTYSSPVRLSVANYHRLRDVLDHPEYMFVDSITDTYSGNHAMLRNPKIYINDDVYTENRNGAEVQLNEFDYLIELYNNHLIYGKQDGIKKITGRNNNGQIQYAKNLEFILQSNVEPLYYKDNEWKLGDSGSGKNCFQGNLHGDGYTIGGLTHSLFNKLCGNVYNLGVTGSFTGAGISDNGGTVYNSWISTTGTPATDIEPIANGGIVINSYYNSAQYAGNYDNDATAATTREFVNGTVAYNLNGYYQQKRNDIANNKKRKGSDGAYLQNNGVSVFPTLQEFSGSESSSSLYVDEDYVEERMKTGDFRYEKGEVPYQVGEIRYVEGNEDKAAKFVPLYPDDYIFFGQNLTYGLSQSKEHDNLPDRVAKRMYNYSKTTVDNVTTNYQPELIDATTVADNRVFRVPVYTVQSPTEVAGGVHYNRDAVFADTYNEMVIDRDVTAIDFTGYDVNAKDKLFTNSLLDMPELRSFYLKGLTRNLLVYADAGKSDAYTVTYNLLDEAAKEPELNVNSANGYNTVSVVPENEYPMFHLVGKQINVGYRAMSDQFIVDKQNFAAPISYSFNDDYYMWYQRRPAYYANSSEDGWEGLILPFTADLVTTQTKGEITHFYGNSDKGHEYWLRGFTGVSDSKAQFTRPQGSAGYASYEGHNSGEKYQVSNSYLYDTYYSRNNSYDANRDDYFEYYNGTRTYDDYLLTTANMPYIVAYPGVTYYEFDMSGNFVAENTATPAPAKLDPQVVTYVSVKEQIIKKYSDSDLTSGTNEYILYGTYLKEPVSGSYKIDDEGSGFALQNGSTEVAEPFRVYLKREANSAPTRGGVLEYIPIGGEADNIAEQAPLSGLNIYSRNNVIYIESALDHETMVTIYSTSGQIITRVKVAPGATVKVPISANGVYIVNRKKIIV
ncbi:MAG: T9SS type A sorting domain-containing protein, partial [Bacteroidaceae bacterium]|nr:T9SS type A sorting domain-containing protein [Bacteroidaceae bacterium]